MTVDQLVAEIRALYVTARELNDEFWRVRDSLGKDSNEAKIKRNMASIRSQVEANRMQIQSRRTILERYFLGGNLFDDAVVEPIKPLPEVVRKKPKVKPKTPEGVGLREHNQAKKILARNLKALEKWDSEEVR